jgi:hypothetical protein
MTKLLLVPGPLSTVYTEKIYMFTQADGNIIKAPPLDLVNQQSRKILGGIAKNQFMPQFEIDTELCS